MDKQEKKTKQPWQKCSFVVPLLPISFKHKLAVTATNGSLRLKSAPCCYTAIKVNQPGFCYISLHPLSINWGLLQGGRGSTSYTPAARVIKLHSNPGGVILRVKNLEWVRAFRQRPEAKVGWETEKRRQTKNKKIELFSWKDRHFF